MDSCAGSWGENGADDRICPTFKIPGLEVVTHLYKGSTMSLEALAALNECLAIIRALITSATPREHNEALVRAHAMLAKMGVEE